MKSSNDDYPARERSRSSGACFYINSFAYTGKYAGSFASTDCSLTSSGSFIITNTGSLFAIVTI